jgi:hypothetical protein
MRGVKPMLLRSAIFIGALLGATSATWAAAGDLQTKVTRLSKSVTYYRPAQKNVDELVTYIGFKVEISNQTPNTINEVRFDGATSIGVSYTYVGPATTPTPTKDDTQDSTRVALYDSASGTTACSLGANLYSVRCSFRQLKGQESRAFLVFFRAPAASEFPLSTDPNFSGSDHVSFDGQTVYAEGQNGNNPLNNSVDDWPVVQVPLGTSDPTEMKSGVPSKGGRFFTGQSGVPNGTDKFATTIVVPQSAFNTTAEIVEGATTVESCSNYMNTCYGVQLGVPGTFSSASGYLTIILRLDALNIKSGTKIGSISLRYQPDGSTDTFTIGLCGSNGPQNDIPCIQSTTAYKNNYRDNPELSGDFEWVLINTKNGRLEFF